MKLNWRQAVLALSALTALRGQNGFETIAYPGAVNTQSWGINASGEIVGYYSGTDKVNHGFVRRGGVYTTIDFPSATSSLVNGLNPQGDIVAEYTLNGTTYGVLLTGAQSFPIAFPGAIGTEPIGINSQGAIVGDYITPDKVTHGFLLAGSKFTTIDYPGANLTIPQSINPQGDVVGGYRDAATGLSHAFLFSNGNFTSLDYPGATFTTATGINPRGDVVGRYTATGVNHGFILSAGKYTSIDYPGATFTGATSIDPRGDVLGRYVLGGASYGFLLAAQTHYTVTDLGPVGAAPGQPVTITRNGLISGAAAVGNFQHATLWLQGARIDIGQRGLGGNNSIAYGVNALGQAVGDAETPTADPNGEDFCGYKAFGLSAKGSCSPFLWQYGVMTALPTLGGANGVANQINNRGEVAGAAENNLADATCPLPQVHQFKPVTWDGDGVHELPLVSADRDGVALAINDNGSVVGASGACGQFNPNLQVLLTPLHALLWKAGTVTDLGNLGGTGHLNGIVALNVNNFDEVVGNSDLPGDTAFHAFLWSRAKGMQDLGTLPGDSSSVAIGINDGGEVVGVSLDANLNPRAYHWQDGVMTDLNTVIGDSPLQLLLACSINSRGELVGLAVNKKTGETHGYLATPSNSGSQSAALDSSPGNIK